MNHYKRSIPCHYYESPSLPLVILSIGSDLITITEGKIQHCVQMTERGFVYPSKGNQELSVVQTSG